jgi:hypothetical protein
MLALLGVAYIFYDIDNNVIDHVYPDGNQQTLRQHYVEQVEANKP